jgi:hypothetical protein
MVADGLFIGRPDKAPIFPLQVLLLEAMVTALRERLREEEGRNQQLQGAMR